MDKDDLIISSGQNININEVWEKASNLIQNKVASVSYDVWIATLEPVELKGTTLVLATPSLSSKKVLIKNNYVKIISGCLNEVQSSITNVEFVIGKAEDELKETEEPQIEIELPQITEENNHFSTTFNPKYTFDNFVVGSSNQFVAAAAKAVAQNPGEKFNPLFIYGGCGLGKTHLLHAIGNYINETKPELNVAYVTCQNFANDLVDAILDSKKTATSDFRNKYKKVDVLMIDDIQFIIKRNTAQTEFFNTFNDLHSAGKQIIITSDKPPKEINPLEERLRSRFEWGMLADVGIPDIDTKIAILTKKAQIEHYNVSKEVIEYIAGVQSTNIRDLEGMLSRTVFYSGLLGESIVTIETAREALKNLAIQDESEIDAGYIVECVCKNYNMKKEELVSRKRTKEIANVRQIAMYLISDLLPELPQDTVGSIFGRDHATVIYAKRKVAEDIKKNKKFATEINDLKLSIKGK